MATYLITGTSRGIGLAVISHLISFTTSSTASLIFAATRNAEPSAELASLISSPEAGGRVKHVQIDTSNPQLLQNAVGVIDAELGKLPKCGDGEDRGLDMLVNNAGASDFIEGDTPAMTSTHLHKAIDDNVLTTHLLTQALLPTLKRGKEFTTSHGTAKSVINISTTVGSMAHAEDFKVYPIPTYKITKAALNMLTVQWHFALRDEGVRVVAVSPGWVRTSLGGGTADLTTEESAKAVYEMTERVRGKEGEGMSGGAWNVKVEPKEGDKIQYDGGRFPW